MAASDWGRPRDLAAEGEALGFEDSLVQQLAGDELDVLELVRAYPIPALLLAAAGGFWLGSTRGRQLVQSIGDVLGARVERTLESRLER